MNRADRKKLLIAQGAAYRAEACIARQAVREGVQPRALATAALRQVARLSPARAGNGPDDRKSPALLTLLPLLGSVLPALSGRTPALRKMLRGALIAAATAGVAAVVIRQAGARGSKEHTAE